MMKLRKIVMLALLCASSFAVAQTESVLTFSTGFETIKLIRVEGGAFQMGSESINDAKPVHEATVSTFYMADVEVTNAVWADVYGDAGFDSQEVDAYGVRIVDDEAAKGRISYIMATDFVDRLNTLLVSQLPSGCSFAIPTEVQWEYAARGGVNNDAYSFSGSNTASAVAVYDGETERPTYVKTKSPNSLGIYDMSGNVIEWCTDYYAYGYDATPTGFLQRVQRGGHVGSRFEEHMNVAYRASAREDACMWYYGLRLALNIPENSSPDPTPDPEPDPNPDPEKPTSIRKLTENQGRASCLAVLGGRLVVMLPDGRKFDLCGRKL